MNLPRSLALSGGILIALKRKDIFKSIVIEMVKPRMKLQKSEPIDCNFSFFTYGCIFEILAESSMGIICQDS